MTEKYKFGVKGDAMKKDPQNKKKSKQKGIYVQLLVGGMIGIFISLFLLDHVENIVFTWEKFILILLFFIIASFININLHELGHFCFGKLFGYHLISYRVGFLTWNNVNGQMKFSLTKNKGYGGLCAMIPPEANLPLYKHLLYYGGGILVNLASGIVFLLPLFLSGGGTETVELFFLILGVFAICSGIINGVPFISGNFASDGKVIWSIIFKRPFAAQMIEVNKILAQLSSGIRPRDLQFASSINLKDPQMYDISLLINSYYKALDSGNLENTVLLAELLERNLQLIPSPSLPALYYELTFIGCITENRQQAEKFYEKAGKLLKHDVDVNGFRVKAYYEYYMNQNASAAKDYCDKAIAVADQFPLKGQALMELELVHALKELVSEELER